MQRESFERDGYLILEKFLRDDELDLLRSVCDAEVEARAAAMRADGKDADGINVLDRKYFISDVRLRRPEVRPVLLNDRIAEICQATIGQTAYLHNEQFVVKMSDTATSFPWHQDSGYSVYKGRAQRHPPYVTCWVALDDMSEENGTISVLPFSRHEGSRELLEHVWSDEVNALVGYRGSDDGTLVTVPAGSLVAFLSRLLHKSGANKTGRPRRRYFMAYTPTLFRHQDTSKGIYSAGEPIFLDGRIMAPR
jgi:ectoine hydroxylase-related dioxygenase (phytanoyl-CoA dioxygenase family)